VNTLLATLGITKQSLHRVSVDLTDKDLLEKRRSERDGRTKLLYLTDKGAELEHLLFERLHGNMAQTYADAGEQAVKGFWKLMQHLLDDDAHGHFHSFNER
jgi:DNA-binding MarR family transcriptional regulator